MSFVGTAALRPRTADIPWDAALASVLGEPERVRPAFQPIFDLRRGNVAGFEMLARFDVPVQATPIEWFAAAETRGLGPRLEALLLAAGLHARQILPSGLFLSVNLGVPALLSHEVEALLEGRDLSGLVVELGENGPVADYQLLERALDRVRAAGAHVAVDDAGGGYASLRHVLRLRPSYVKLDRSLVSQIDSDPAKLALVEAMGSLAGGIQAALVAEGVERAQEREALAALGIPLAQGFALARPARELHAGLRLPASPARGEGMTAVLERDATVINPAHVPQVVANPGALPGSSAAVVVDDDGRTAGLLVRASGRWALKRRLLSVQPGESPALVARQAMNRPHEDRFDPIVCDDETGRFIGLVAIDRLMGALAGAAA